VTNKVYATPKMVDISSLGVGPRRDPGMPTVREFLGRNGPWGNCNPIEVTLRESYRRVTGHRLRADGPRRRALPGARRVQLQLPARLRPQLRHARRRVESLHRSLQHLGAQPLLHRRHAHDRLRFPCATTETTEVPTGDPSADPNRDEDGNGTADECENAGAGSRCDVYKQKVHPALRRAHRARAALVHLGRPFALRPDELGLSRSGISR
jgi:hypothetical protein